MALYEFNAFSFSGQKRSWSYKQISFLWRPAPTGCHADFQSASAHVLLRSGKCIRRGDGSQEEEVPSITVGDSMPEVARQIPNRYIEKCIWTVTGCIGQIANDFRSEGHVCGTRAILQSSNILRIAWIRYGANKISWPLPNFVSVALCTACSKRTHKPNYCPMKGKVKSKYQTYYWRIVTHFFRQTLSQGQTYLLLLQQQ